MHQFSHAMANALEETIKVLLSQKHLYQNVEVDLGFIAEVAKEVHASMLRPGPILLGTHSASPRPSLERAISVGNSVAAQFWTPYIRTGQGKPNMVRTSGTVGSPIEFQLPTINTFCPHCEDRWPFNPLAEGSLCVVGNEQTQWFLLSYLCQQCKRQAVRFLVRRDGMKLCLTGRDPLEVLPTPKVLPKRVSKYYSDGQVAHHAGQTLAALFLLRVFIEQFWRTHPDVQAVLTQRPRATGEEQGDAYQGTLPSDFKSRFPSLKDIYGSLSAAIHAADANSALFEESCAKVVEHFDARRLYRIN